MVNLILTDDAFSYFDINFITYIYKGNKIVLKYFLWTCTFLIIIITVKFKMNKNHLTHKRSPSEAFKLDAKCKGKSTKTKKKKLADKSKSKTISLIEKSSKKADSKTVVV